MVLEDLEVYKIAKSISDIAWSIYGSIPKEYRYKTGQQFLSSSDSIGANIAEGFGRYHYKDSMKFYYNSRGSLYETEWWVETLNSRNLIEDSYHSRIKSLLEDEKIKLNGLIKSIKSRL